MRERVSAVDHGSLIIVRIVPLCTRSSRAASGWRAEWKYDGERLQIHAERGKKEDIRFELFSRHLPCSMGFRLGAGLMALNWGDSCSPISSETSPLQGNLKNVTARFPEIEDSLRGCSFKSIILDAEVAAVDGVARLQGDVGYVGVLSGAALL